MKKVLCLFLLLSMSISFCSSVSLASQKNVTPGNYMTEQDFNNSNFTTITDYSAGNSIFGMKNYFANLYDYSPINSQGSCGYVSFIQYLSYYDTFYNDSIIAEVYEQNNGVSTSLE